MKKALYSLFVCGLLLINAPVMAHGGGGIEVDTCVINIGNYRMHFTAYQPETLGGEELCWDIPVAGHAILVFDLIERVLRDRPVEVRIVEEQPGAAGPAQYKTVAEKPAQLYPRGTIELETHFSSPGKYMAVVTVGGDQQPLVFKTPMRVAMSSGSKYVQWIAAIALIVGAVALAVWFGRRGEKKEATA
jgi:hypothetical protein